VLEGNPLELAPNTLEIGPLLAQGYFGIVHRGSLLVRGFAHVLV
jgi:hypothetical protein